MITLTMSAGWKTLYIKTKTVAQAKKKAAEEFKSCPSFYAAHIYDPDGEIAELVKQRGHDWKAAY